MNLGLKAVDDEDLGNFGGEILETIKPHLEPKVYRVLLLRMAPYRIRVEDIASATKVSENTVRSWIKKAIEKVRRLFWKRNQ